MAEITFDDFLKVYRNLSSLIIPFIRYQMVGISCSRSFFEHRIDIHRIGHSGDESLHRGQIDTLADQLGSSVFIVILCILVNTPEDVIDDFFDILTSQATSQWRGYQNQACK